jgi:hypothetical protein
MTPGVRLYLVGSLALVALAGCGRGFFLFAEREPWRHDAEERCLKSGAVKEGAGIVRIAPIEGPGICGADFPLKVAVIGENGAYGYDDEPRPPGTIAGGAAAQPRWPIAAAPPSYRPAPADPGYAAPAASANAPLSIAPPGMEAPADAVDEVEPPTRYGAEPPYPAAAPGYERAPAYPGAAASYPTPRNDAARYGAPDTRSAQPLPGGENARPEPVPLGRERAPQVTASVGPVAVMPAATLACPIVSALEQWIDGAVQPAAQRWFGERVVEIKQISAYSCRGMNGQPGAHISEHAFGNALDIAAFTLADGRRVVVQTGWNGSPEEQGFLRDVEAAACQEFNTVLAPGSNRFHYNHIHVDLMRRSSGRRICNPRAEDGEVVAARAAQRSGRYARHYDSGVTGSIARPNASVRGGAVRPGADDTPDDEADWVEDDVPSNGRVN